MCTLIQCAQTVYYECSGCGMMIEPYSISGKKKSWLLVLNRLVQYVFKWSCHSHFYSTDKLYCEYHFHMHIVDVSVYLSLIKSDRFSRNWYNFLCYTTFAILPIWSSKFHIGHDGYESMCGNSNQGGWRLMIGQLNSISKIVQCMVSFSCIHSLRNE